MSDSPQQCGLSGPKNSTTLPFPSPCPAARKPGFARDPGRSHRKNLSGDLAGGSRNKGNETATHGTGHETARGTGWAYALSRSIFTAQKLPHMVQASSCRWGSRRLSRMRGSRAATRMPSQSSFMRLSAMRASRARAEPVPKGEGDVVLAGDVEQAGRSRSGGDFLCRFSASSAPGSICHVKQCRAPGRRAPPGEAAMQGHEVHALLVLHSTSANSSSGSMAVGSRSLSMQRCATG